MGTLGDSIVKARPNVDVANLFREALVMSERTLMFVFR